MFNLSGDEDQGDQANDDDNDDWDDFDFRYSKTRPPIEEEAQTDIKSSSLEQLQAPLPDLTAKKEDLLEPQLEPMEA
jgi:hypothetical protein